VESGVTALGKATRRRALHAGGSVLAAVLSAGCAGNWIPGRGAAGSQSGVSMFVGNDRGVHASFDPNALTAEPMVTTLRTVDDTPVLYQYGDPVPSFDTWSGNADSRLHRSLDGQWRFSFDPEDRGVEDGWHEPDFDDSDWQHVSVPLPWDLYDTPGFASYDGSNFGTGTAFRNGFGWYRTRFSLDSTWEDRLVRANFLGASYMAWVFVDGTLVGQHEGGQTPFSLDVSDALDPGPEHVLAVRVFRRPWWSHDASVDLPVVDATEIPGRPVDYWPYAGLTRSVYLEGTPLVTVSKLLVDAREGTLSVRAVVENRGDGPASRYLTVDPGEGTGGTETSVSVDLDPGEVGVVPLELDVPDASPWSLASPTRYELTATLSGGLDAPGDQLATRYGMRTLSTAGGRLRLNGDPVFLKGVNWHEESADRGRSLTTDEYDAVLARLTDLNANFLRNSHYNRHPYLYEAADEAGVLVMDEADNMWLSGNQQRVQVGSYGLSRALVAAMVWNQHNHPSVGLWSLQNESSRWSTAYREWLADMRSAAKTLDRQGRPVTWAARSPRDPAFDLADVVGFNEYYGYFSGTNSDLGTHLDSLHRKYPNKPLLVTENGAWSSPGLRGRTDTSATRAGTPQWQAAEFDAHWNQMTDGARVPYVAGYTYWILRDYKERNGYNQRSFNGISTMGLLPFSGDVETLTYEAFRAAENPLADG